MLSHYPGGTNGKNKSEMILVQRKIILILLTLLIITIFSIAVKIGFDIVRQKNAEDIIVSAKEEADQILTEAKDDASEIKHSAKVDASQEATDITETAKNEAQNITKSAEVKADKIIDEAINTQIDEIETLLAITEAEAGNQPVEGKAAVASTIKNRIKSDEFEADSIKEVVYAPGQFDPVTQGTLKKVTPSPSTVEGVKLCLEGKDYSNGALYFYNPSASSRRNILWFNTLKTTTVIGDHVFKR